MSYSFQNIIRCSSLNFSLSSYCRKLEENSFRGRTSDFVLMFIFGAFCMLLCAFFVNLLFLGEWYCTFDLRDLVAFLHPQSTYPKTLKHRTYHHLTHPIPLSPTSPCPQFQVQLANGFGFSGSSILVFESFTRLAHFHLFCHSGHCHK